MSDLIVRENNLPTTLEDLSKFVLIGRDKLQAVRAEISALQKLNVAEEVLAQKRIEQSEIGAVVLLAEMKCGELLKQMPKAKENQYTKNAVSLHEEKALSEQPKPKLEVAAELGFNKNQVSQFQTLADNPDIVRRTIADAVDNNQTPTRAAALENIQQAKKPHVSFNSGNNEWYTPADIIEAARHVLGTITLDPASSAIANETVKAKTFYTAEDDGLIQAKSLVNHGHWQQWLQNNFQLTYQTATKFIQCAERFSNVATSRDLNRSQMIEMLSLPSAEETEKFITEKAAEGKKVADMTIKQLREEIAEWKKTLEQKDKNHAAELDELNEQLADLEQELKDRPTVKPDDYDETKEALVEAKVALERAKDASKKQSDAYDELKETLDKKKKEIKKLNERLNAKAFNKTFRRQCSLTT